MKKISSIIAIALLATAPSVFAQKAGSLSVELGITQLSPQVESGDLSAPAFPNTKADVTSNTGLTGAITYMVTDNIAVNLPLGLGFKHNIVGADRAAGFGKLAEVRALPITLLGQYRFGEPDAKFRPYVGAGLTYAKFYKETGSAAMTALTATPGSKTPTTLSVQSKLAPTIQLGGIINITDKWFVNAHYAKTFLKVRTTFSTNQTQDITLNPNAFSVGVGYKF
jgi:outer membrane protein